ncbi:retropepsin-like aspartic protease family protein [Parasphingopyxis marina]|uniref:TIGR02281 family clan AA aspartic protease n=1 Tax=Parasphingopyxis marina TaxID=2761622 RepID=A0A842I1P6_9SPHN|nr:TIGR02281 family clan AA aspartic protease [Parasphingopyxis marina]MBC2779182.1 TIGR02281 family clan AA aspartic protease [Parasphingopyxis marina]
MDRMILIAGVSMIAIALLSSGGEESVTSSPTKTIDTTSADAPDERAGNGSAEFSARRAPDGHFYADVRINGATSRMMIDTGASQVVLTRSDAQRAGIQARPGEFTATAQTAGGEIALKPVTIDRLALGPVDSRNVPALVAEADLPVSLLGQSFLERVGTVEISGDELRLR